MKYMLIVIVLVAVFAVGESQYQESDVRCKCVCPKTTTDRNGTTHGREIYIRVFKEPSSCKCQNVVSPIPTSEFCERCECQWQRRNTTTIKVVVILIICILSLLVLYMLFLLCLDPLMSRRPKTYQEQHNEEDTQSVTQVAATEDSGLRPRPDRSGVISRVKQEVNRVKGEQQKWKGTVSEQRKNIFDRHTMLN